MRGRQRKAHAPMQERVARSVALCRSLASANQVPQLRRLVAVCRNQSGHWRHVIESAHLSVCLSVCFTTTEFTVFRCCLSLYSSLYSSLYLLSICLYLSLYLSLQVCCCSGNSMWVVHTLLDTCTGARAGRRQCIHPALSQHPHITIPQPTPTSESSQRWRYCYLDPAARTAALRCLEAAWKWTCMQHHDLPCAGSSLEASVNSDSAAAHDISNSITQQHYCCLSVTTRCK